MPFETNNPFRPFLGHFSDRLAFPAQSSVLDETVIQQRLLPEYQIPTALLCRYYCRGDSDIYRIATETGDYYLKLYRPPHSVALAAAEASCMAALAEAGVPIVRPVLRKDGHFASEVGASEGPRPALLFAAAPPPFPAATDAKLAHSLGEAVAELHYAADGLPHEFDLPRTRHLPSPAEQLHHARQFLTPRDYDFIVQQANEIYPQLETLCFASRDWGLCHRDLVRSNLRLTEEGTITFFDFGRARYDFRCYELSLCHQTVSRMGKEAADEFWAAFQTGYTTVRPLPANLDTLLPLLRFYRHIEHMGYAAASCPLRMGEEMILGFLAETVAKVGELRSAIQA